jgi:hypothetical protein
VSVDKDSNVSDHSCYTSNCRNIFVKAKHFTTLVADAT